jgi:transcriptional regulator with XRE-family HTH domain
LQTHRATKHKAFRHMPRSIPNHIRSHRKRWRLSQRELAQLVGLKSREPVSRVERFLGKPSLKFALACEVLFDVSARKLFPGLFDDLTEDVLNECEILHDHISSKTGSDANEKRKLLNKLLKPSKPNNSHV